LKAELSVTPDIKGSDYTYKAVLKTKGDGKVIKESTGTYGKDSIDWTFKDGEIAGWYPIGYGAQPLYELEISLIDGVSRYHSRT